MGTLCVSLFGNVSVKHDDMLGDLRLTPVIQELLAFLLLNGRYPLPREVLAEQFWGEYCQEKARGCLKTALWRLRRALEPEGVPSGTYLLSTQQGEIGFNYDSSHWVDADIFLEKVTPVLSRPSKEVSSTEIAACSSALTLYNGDLLEGFYDNWAIRQRERFRIIYLDTLTWLVHYYKGQRQYEISLGYARKILEVDPLREEIHREVMRLYIESGLRPQALRQFETCREVLKRELGIIPMEETQQLYRLILAEEGIPILPPRVHDDDLLVSVLSQIQSARQTLNEAQEQFLKASQMLEGLLLREK
jgi:DNA-binding SARP family transcriptional activator